MKSGDKCCRAYTFGLLNPKRVGWATDCQSASINLRSNLFQMGKGQESLLFHSQRRRKRDAIGLCFPVTLKKFCSLQTKLLMSKSRVRLLCSEHLFGESMERMLRGAADLELIGSWILEVEVCQGIATVRPDVISQSESISGSSSTGAARNSGSSSR